MTQQDDKTWAALAEPNRRLLIDHLLTSHKTTASSLAAKVPFTRQAVTKHLNILTTAGLVKPEQHGREVIYTIQADELSKAAKAMANVATQWHERLQAIKRIAETVYNPKNSM